MKNWEHQDQALEGIRRERLNGKKSILAVAPCGAGKSKIMRDLAREEVAAGGNVRIYLHRTMLLSQMVAQFEKDGFDFGVQAAGYPLNLDAPIQLCMIDTVYARAIRGSTLDLGAPTLVLWDECHNQTGGKARSVSFGGRTNLGSTWKGHLENGAVQVGFTATPVGLGDFYEVQIQCGNYRQMRAVKAHLPVKVFAPSEMDLRGLSRQKNNEFSPGDLEERSYAIFGDVFESWKRFNPDGLPTILFAPSVASSRWFAEEWCNRGIPAAHIDGEKVMVPRELPFGDGYYLESFDNSSSVRDEILDGSKSGKIKVVCNRFVLREAIDMPWLYHAIMATAFGSISSYLQSVGRVQRFHPDYQYKILQDHGGNYHRHGSPNMDRDWEIGCTEASVAKARIDTIKKSDSPESLEGIACPKCFMVRASGVRCPNCGHTHKQSVRRVRCIDGELQLMRGVVNKKPKGKTQDDIWTGIIFSSVGSNLSVSSAVSRFFHKCREANIVPSVRDLKNKPPAPDSTEWNYPMRDVYPWAKRRAKVK